MFIKVRNVMDLWELYYSNVEYFRNNKVPVRKYADELNSVVYITLGFDDTELFPMLSLENDNGVVSSCECEDFDEFESTFNRFSLMSVCKVA